MQYLVVLGQILLGSKVLLFNVQTRQVIVHDFPLSLAFAQSIPVKSR